MGAIGCSSLIIVPNNSPIPIINMYILLLSLLGLAVVALIAGWWRQRKLRQQLERGEISEIPGIKKAHADGCCGQHEVCEKDSLLAAVSKDIEYYDDEELDRFQGREADSYTESEIEAFDEVLTTMQSDEVAGWVRSLQLRGINLPDALKDEVFLIVGERRI